MQLDRFTGSTQALREACGAALKGLHSCLSGNAVHGDVRIPNIFVRWVVCLGLLVRVRVNRLLRCMWLQGGGCAWQ